MSKKDTKRENLMEDKKGIATVQNQLNKSYQSGVIDQLNNNKSIYTYNNQKK